MCGIAGIARFSGRPTPTIETLASMVETLHHRGPDDDGLEIVNGVALGMRRLSVIDIDGGAQPVFNEDRSIRAVFNGEIYNYRDLRNELSRLGHDFQSESDSEVIVHAYEEYGLDFAGHLNGMFAIALHDVRAGRVILVRDPVGIKPLYYCCGPDEIVFGSEVKALLASGLVHRELNIDALADFLAWEYVPAPQTLLRSVQKLEPGTMIDIDLHAPDPRPVQYWNAPTHPGETAAAGSRVGRNGDRPDPALHHTADGQ